MNCCNPMTGQCQQGHGCPVRTTRRYTCNELGACNSAGPDCLESPRHDDAFDMPQTPWDQLVYWLAVLASATLTVGVLAGIAGYFAGL